jgi:Tat protein translocase TatB subunit
MNFFGVGTTELFVILIVILVVFGPERLPEIAKRIGGAARELNQGLDQVKNEMNDALNLSMETDKARMIPPGDASSTEGNTSSENPPTPTPATDTVPVANELTLTSSTEETKLN